MSKSLQVSDLPLPRPEQVARHTEKFRANCAPMSVNALWDVQRIFIDDLHAVIADGDAERAHHVLEVIEGLGGYIRERGGA